MFVCFFLRPKRGKESLSEFLEPDESDADIARPFFNGHNRWVDSENKECKL